MGNSRSVESKFEISVMFAYNAYNALEIHFTVLLSNVVPLIDSRRWRVNKSGHFICNLFFHIQSRSKTASQNSQVNS